MKEREEDISRLIFDRAKDCWSGEFPISMDVARYIAKPIAAALAQAEREREFERERADNQHEAAEMFQNQYREALQERDHSRGLVNGLIAERNAARAEVERLKAQLNANCLQRDALQIRTRALEAALLEMLDVAERLAWYAARGGSVTVGQYDARILRARAALTEPTPPQEEPR